MFFAFSPFFFFKKKTRFFSFFFVFACVSFHFLFFSLGYLHSGKSKVKRVTVGRDTRVFEFVKLILRP